MSSAISVSLQVGLALFVISMTGVVTPDVTRSALTPPRMVRAVFLPAEVVETPALPAPEVEPVAEVKLPEPEPVAPAPIVVREVEKIAPADKPVEMKPVEVAPKPAPPAPAPPKPAPTVSVGAFDTAPAAARTPEPARRIERAGFDVAAPPGTAKAVPFESTPAVGAFDNSTATTMRQAGDRNAVVNDSGFNQSNAAAQPAQQSRVVRDSGFGGASATERPRSQQTAPTTNAGFSDARLVEQARRAEAAPHRPSVVPVEVLSKPSPAYTDEARRLKIEGEVVLEVEFCANGVVKVMRLVRGLGHGLDESAAVAARKIQFKPATSEGRPVDYKTTVQIVFRLA